MEKFRNKKWFVPVLVRFIDTERWQMTFTVTGRIKSTRSACFFWMLSSIEQSCLGEGLYSTSKWPSCCHRSMALRSIWAVSGLPEVDGVIDWCAPCTTMRTRQAVLNVPFLQHLLRLLGTGHDTCKPVQREHWRKLASQFVKRDKDACVRQSCIGRLVVCLRCGENSRDDRVLIILEFFDGSVFYGVRKTAVYRLLDV